MNTTTLTILTIIIGLSITINIINIVINIKHKKKLKEALTKTQDYDNKNKMLSNELLLANAFNKNYKFDLNKIKKAAEDLHFTYQENNRIDKETIDNLKSIISEHDKEMREQREKFEKLFATRYDKKDLLLYVNQAFKAGCIKSNKLSEYIKEFKSNL
jgi:heme/copper-type cytochrome/quinol oxidase subunit 1